MKLKLSTSLLSAFTLLLSVAPAQAQYYPTTESLAGDPRAICKNEIASNSYTNILDTDNSINMTRDYLSESASKHDNVTKKAAGGGGKLSFKGVGIGGGGKKESIVKTSGASRSKLETNSTDAVNNIYGHDQSYTEAVVCEKADCDGYLQSSAIVQSAQINADVQMKAIEAKQQESFVNKYLSGEW